MSAAQIAGAVLIAGAILAVGIISKSGTSWGEWLAGWAFAFGLTAAVALGCVLLGADL